MEYKGTYNANTAYAVGDCVFGPDSNVYHCLIPNTGMPVISKYWEQVTKDKAEVMQLLCSAIAAVAVEVVDNLTSTATGKALSAKQGKTLKGLIDALDARVTALEPEPEPTEGT